MKSLKLFTLGALAAASLESQAAVIHTTDWPFDASVTIETVADGNLKFTVEFNGHNFLDHAHDLRLAYIQFPQRVTGNRINTSDPDEILVDVINLDTLQEDDRGRTYYSLNNDVPSHPWITNTDEQYFMEGETDVFFIEPINEAQTLDADTLFNKPMKIVFAYEILGQTDGNIHPIQYEAFTFVDAIPEPSTALFGAIAALGLIRRRR